MVTIKNTEVNNFENMLADISFEKLGTVTEGEIIIESEHWGDIGHWKQKYDTALEAFFTDYLPE